MARQLQMMHPSQGTAQVGMAGVSLLFCAFALFMCASHARKWRHRWNACLGYSYEFEDPVIELNQEATVVMSQRVIACIVNSPEPDNGNDEMFFSREQQAAVWQKNTHGRELPATRILRRHIIRPKWKCCSPYQNSASSTYLEMKRQRKLQGGKVISESTFSFVFPSSP